MMIQYQWNLSKLIEIWNEMLDINTSNKRPVGLYSSTVSQLSGGSNISSFIGGWGGGGGGGGGCVSPQG